MFVNHEITQSRNLRIDLKIIDENIQFHSLYDNQ